MRENFGLREEFNFHPLIEVIIKARGYRLLILPFFLASAVIPSGAAYHRGRRFDRLVDFSIILI